MQLDHPNIRTSLDCALCNGDKRQGEVTCWSCWRRHGMRYGNPEMETRIAQRERELEDKRLQELFTVPSASR